MIEFNEFNQPVNPEIKDWEPRPTPPRTTMQGEYCLLEPLDIEKHADKLFATIIDNNDGESCTYLGYDPMPITEFRAWLQSINSIATSLPYVIIENKSQTISGIAVYANINTAHGTIEIGNLHYSKSLKKTRAATEAMFLMMQRVFDELGYRRYEWKCNALNKPSRAAAKRLGFTFEGIFRQHWVTKNRNRDTAWYSIINSEWPPLKEKLQRWLQPENFHTDGNQKISLSDMQFKSL
jgi:RimJ/RimL family protein N-acetyltransferase